LVAVGAQELGHFAVGGFDQVAHLLVDQLLGRR